MAKGFLPVTREEMEERGIDRPDFVYVIGDAYVDHPSFGHAIISRVLEAHGYSVGIISSRTGRTTGASTYLESPGWPSWFPPETWDSMVNHYYVSGKRRKEDALYAGRADGEAARIMRRRSMET